ncbi:AKIB1 protein, partial [Polypterus senegalus]
MAAAELFGCRFQVYRNGQVFYTFRQPPMPLKHLRFTGDDFSSGHFDVRRVGRRGLLYAVFSLIPDWDREKLLEAWMSNAEDCCQRSGVQMPTPPPSGYNAWDTLPSPRTPRTTRSSVTSPDEISLSPGDEDMPLCGICMCSISVFEDPVDMPCGHEFCRACWEGFLNMKIQEGEAHNIFCPAYDCFQLVPVEVIESVVSREMDKRYLQFDIKAFVENNPAIRWCPTAGCERAVRLTRQGPGTTGSDPLTFPLLRAPAVDCGKGHLFCCGDSVAKDLCWYLEGCQFKSHYCQKGSYSVGPLSKVLNLKVASSALYND